MNLALMRRYLLALFLIIINFSLVSCVSPLGEEKSNTKKMLQNPDLAEAFKSVVGGSTCETGGDGNSIAAVAYSGSFPNVAGVHDVTLTLSNLGRSVHVYVPDNRPAQPYLLVAFHWTAEGTDLRQGESMAWNFRQMADDHGMIIAAPEARVQPIPDWDQHVPGQKYWETRFAADPTRGCDVNRNPDLLLARAIIQEAKRVYNIDPKRIYLVGFSNGGFFSLHAAVALRDQVAAFAEMSSGLVTCENTNNCVWGGDGSTCAQLKSEAGYCSCSGTEKPTKIPTTGRMPPAYITHGNADWTVSVVFSCELAARLQSLNHSATVNIRNVEYRDHDIPDPASSSFYATLWTFFQQHPLP
ncbi:MAG: prolyl oligopeptidase family serine peptidase [Bdellovibrio sp.]|nr:prolyl oligopeptidase family serine peptidase [Bdellovibrio sp.]